MFDQVRSYVPVVFVSPGSARIGASKSPSGMVAKAATGKWAAGTDGSLGVKVTTPKCQASRLDWVTSAVTLTATDWPAPSVKLVGSTDSPMLLAEAETVQVT